MVTANPDTGILLTTREQRLRELGLLFSDWANTVENDLFNNKRRLDSVGYDNLAKDFRLYSKQLKELRQLDFEYKFLNYSSVSHPDCSRARLRLKKLCALVINECTSRYYSTDSFSQIE